MTASERERVERLLDNLDRADQQRVLSSVSSFAGWLSNVAYSIYVKVKDAIYEVWESVVCAIGDTINAVGEAAICLAKKISQTETAREISRTEFAQGIARSEFARNLARTELAQGLAHFWRKFD